MVAMQLLASVAAAAAAGKLRGASLIQLLHDRSARTAGDATARRLLQRLLQAACAPYFRFGGSEVFTTGDCSVGSHIHNNLIFENDHVITDSVRVVSISEDSV